MRVLLFGGSGNLGSRCAQALLAHNHTLIIYIRNPTKFQSMMAPALLSRLESIVIGDALDSITIAKTIRDHDIEAIVHVAGNQVLPWKEYLLPRLAKAISDAAIMVGRERGRPLRAWVCCGIGVLRLRETGKFLDEYLPKIAAIQHRAANDVISPIPLTALRWSLICVSIMKDSDPQTKIYTLLPKPNHHNLLIEKTYTPSWENTWWRFIPVIGWTINVVVVIIRYFTATYEEVADFIAEDLEGGGSRWIGEKVGYMPKRGQKAD